MPFFILSHSCSASICEVQRLLKYPHAFGWLSMSVNSSLHRASETVSAGRPAPRITSYNVCYTKLLRNSSTNSFSNNKTSGNNYITISQIEPESNNKYDKVFNRRNFIILSAIALLSLAFNVAGVLIPAINKSKTNKISTDRKKIIKALKYENDLDKIFSYFNEGLKLKYGINIKSMSSYQIYSYFENYGFKTLEDSTSTVEKIISIKKELEAFKFLNKNSDMLNVKELIKNITQILS